ncbi:MULTISPECIES: hypothetical protein [Acidiphilium]|nr:MULTISPECIES: hypothetical protein [Acidiphilium]
MAKPARKTIPSATELYVLDQSRYRCALCFRLNGNLNEKRGQIVHLDHDRANCVEDNLAFLCLDHHSQYDSRTSQHRNYTPQIIKKARAKLYQAIADGHHTSNSYPRSTVRETDRVMFSELVDMMNRSRTADFLRRTCFGSQSFHWRELDEIDNYLQCTNGAEHEFIDLDLETLRQRFIAEYDTFRSLLAENTRPTKHNPPYRTVPMEWEETDPKRYTTTVMMLRDAADKVCTAYDELVRTARERMAP